MFSVSSDRTNAACKTKPNMSTVTLHNPTVTMIWYNPAHVNSHSDPAQPSTWQHSDSAQPNTTCQQSQWFYTTTTKIKKICLESQWSFTTQHVNSHNDPSQPNMSTVTMIFHNMSTVTMILHNPTCQQSQWSFTTCQQSQSFTTQHVNCHNDPAQPTTCQQSQ